MCTLVRDLRYALRAFAKSPGFTAAAILSLAIGIGANTAIFSITSALLLRPLPYKNSDRLVIMWNSSPGLGITRDWFSTAQYFDIKNNHHGLEQVAIAIGGNYNLTGDGDPERVGMTRVSHEPASHAGREGLLGRLFTAEDDETGGPTVAILSYGMWARRYGADPEDGWPQHHHQLSSVPGGWECCPGLLLCRVKSCPRWKARTKATCLFPYALPPNPAEERGHEDYNIVGKATPRGFSGTGAG